MKKNKKLLLTKLLKIKKIDALLITNLTNIRYLSGFTGSNAYILISKKKNYFFTDNRYSIQSKKEVDKYFEVIVYDFDFIRYITNLLKDLKIKTLGFEGKYTNFSFINEIKRKSKIKLKDCSEEISTLRKFKSKNEIELIKTSLRIAEKSFLLIKDMLKPGIRERDIAIELEYQIKKNGAEGTSFPIIVASGDRSALPHASVSKKKLKINEMIIIDFGAKYRGYCSDITYTINLDCKNDLLLKAYRVVKDCINIALERIKPFQRIDKLDNDIDEYIRRSGFSSGLIHSLGHGVGLDIHELPVINRKKKEIFKEGMVFTIEPGIYLENIGGIRIEIMGYVTSNGFKMLNQKHLNL